MEVNTKSIVHSLSGTNDKIIEHLPYLLQDLWELGGGTKSILELVERNMSSKVSSFMVLDLCCGKGPVIINLLKKYKCSGKGIDLFEPFIKEAKDKSIDNHVEHLVDFDMLDIKDAVELFRNYDLVIYGGDTEVLGNETESLNKVSRCCKEEGYLIYSCVTSSVENLTRLFEKSGLRIIDYLIVERKEIKNINKVNNESIKRRAQELIKKYPDQKKLFRDYVKSQELESYILENNLKWVHILSQRFFEQASC